MEQVKAGTLPVDRAYNTAKARERQAAANKPQPETPKVKEDQTITLLDHKGNPYNYPKPKGKATFNQQKGTEIGWAMWSWNPVTAAITAAATATPGQLPKRETWRSITRLASRLCFITNA